MTASRTSFLIGYVVSSADGFCILCHIEEKADLFRMFSKSYSISLSSSWQSIAQDTSILLLKVSPCSFSTSYQFVFFWFLTISAMTGCMGPDLGKGQHCDSLRSIPFMLSYIHWHFFFLKRHFSLYHFHPNNFHLICIRINVMQSALFVLIFMYSKTKTNPHAFEMQEARAWTWWVQIWES